MDSRKLFGLKRIEQVKIDRARLEAVAPRDERGQEVSNRPAYQADIKGSTTEKKDTAIATDKDATPSKPDASSQVCLLSFAVQVLVSTCYGHRNGFHKICHRISRGG